LAQKELFSGSAVSTILRQRIEVKSAWAYSLMHGHLSLQYHQKLGARFASVRRHDTLRRSRARTKS
jgi:hypothetical protein